MVRDSEPTYKELGHFCNISDLGLVTYNPYNENNPKYLGYAVEDFVIRTKERLRTISVVKNSIGTSNVALGAIFLGECGYFREAPHPNEEDSIIQFLELLGELP